MNMTIEDIKYYRENATDILRKSAPYATIKATEEAFNALIWLTEATEALEKARKEDIY